MPNTPNGLPYPNPTDPVSLGAADIRALAEAVDPHVAALYYAEATAQVHVFHIDPAGGNGLLGAPLTFDGETPITVRFQAAYWQIDVSGRGLYVALYDGLTNIGVLGVSYSTVPIPVNVERRLTPTAGTHSYGIYAYLSAAANGYVGAGSGGVNEYMPMSMTITRA